MTQTTNTASAHDSITDLYAQLHELKARIRNAVHEQHGSGVPEDYAFAGQQGTVKLSQLFGDRDDLLVIHNMGRSCSYCALWADGLAGFYPMITQRCAIVLTSPDTPEAQAQVKQQRGWPFQMLSVKGNTFAKDMGFHTDRGYLPGVSAFHRSGDGAITRTGSAFFGPGDDFCPIWPLFDLLEGGAKGWEPK